VVVWRIPADERFLATMADSAMAASASGFNRERGVRATRADLRLSFAAPAPADDSLTCTARVISGGRRTTFVEAEIVDDAGHLVAKAWSTYLLST
jgi:uncharacterized protein (TIGR00369 family)